MWNEAAYQRALRISDIAFFCSRRASEAGHLALADQYRQIARRHAAQATAMVDDHAA